MSVKIRIPSKKGDTQMCVPLQKAKTELNERIGSGWIVAINNTIEKTTAALKDGDNVIVLPRISGG